MAWETSSVLDAADVSPEQVWSVAYADVAAWPRWNGALASAELDGAFAVGTRARLRFKTGLRLRFTIVELDPGRLFTDECRLPGGRMGHRHLVEPTTDGVRLENTIYIEGPASRLWSLVLGGPARRGMPGWQRDIVALARAAR